MNLFLFQLSMFLAGCHTDHLALFVNFMGHPVTLFHRDAEKFLQHIDDIRKRMVIIIVQNDMVRRQLLSRSLLLFFNFLFGQCFYWHGVPQYGSVLLAARTSMYNFCGVSSKYLNKAG